MRVNKAELAQILGISLPTVGVYLTRYGDGFPVLERGGRGRDWWFESESVVAFLKTRQEEEEAGNAERQAELNQLALPLGHNGGPAIDAPQSMRPAELLMLWKVRKLQREEAYACGRLIEVAKITLVMEDLLRNWSRDLHQMLRQFGRERDLPADLVADLNKALTGCQRHFVAYMRASYASDASQPTLFGVAAE